jgi:hypothetical protein
MPQDMSFHSEYSVYLSRKRCFLNSNLVEKYR